MKVDLPIIFACLADEYLREFRFLHQAVFPVKYRVGKLPASGYTSAVLLSQATSGPHSFTEVQDDFYQECLRSGPFTQLGEEELSAPQ